jgi:GR25 family glycosyltransferase involved in LPS biosynthesis
MFKLNQDSFPQNINILHTQINKGPPEWKIFSWINDLLTVPYTDDKYIVELLKLQGSLTVKSPNTNSSIPIEDSLGFPLTQYNRDICDHLSKHIKSSHQVTTKSIIITMTTCKRYDLFQQTVNSFLACCKDLEDYIIDWITVDDNSSAIDQEKMKQNYPFMTFIFKDPTQKGHARSMNILREKVLAINPSFIFHLEDDWRFFAPGKWLTKCIAVLESNKQYGQCLLNRAYGEDVKRGSMIWGGHRRYITHPEDPQSKLRYYIHEYATSTALDRISKKLGEQGLGNSTYWPHFSLRVGITRLEVYKTVGEFNESAEHFEREYANRYRTKYLTTFLDNVICTHIGRRTYERDGPKLNAYDLNAEKQFGSDPKSVDEPEIKLDAISLEAKQMQIPKTDPRLVIKIYVLNLKRRPDRLQKFREINQSELVHFHVFNAIDGQELKPDLVLQRLFEPNDYNYRRGIMGCAISHIMMWSELVSSNFLNGMVIIEDDARLSKKFMNKLLHVLERTPEADIIFLHHHAYNQWRNKDDANENLIPVATKWSKDESIKRSMGGTTAYYITRAGASRLLSEIDRQGVKYGIDWVMFHYNVNKVFYTSPFLAFADCAQVKGNDSDIQNDYDGAGFTNDQWLSAELFHWGETGTKNGIGYHGMRKDEKSKVIYSEGECECKQLLTNLMLFPRSDHIERWIRNYPVHFCSVGKWLISVPDTMLTLDDMKNRVWNGSHFSTPSLERVISPFS